MTMDTTVRTNPILKSDLGDHAAFTGSRALTAAKAATTRARSSAVVTGSGTPSRGSVRGTGPGVSATLPTGGRLLTETSAKFHVEGLHEELHRAGLDPTHTWTDPAGDYSVTLATKPADRDPR